MDSYTATGLAEGFIEGTEEEIIEAWQHLENTGLAYQLQGFFGRQCQALIEAGVISPRPAQTDNTPLRAFECHFTWSAPSGTGSSSYLIRGKNVRDAQARTLKAFGGDFPGYTFGEFGTCQVVG